MCARWAQNGLESPKLPVIQQTIIASWLPWKYYYVGTIQLDTSSDLAKLTKSIGKNINYKAVPSEILGYVTQVFRCDKDGIVRSYDKPLFEREYFDLSEAIDGHKDAVKKFAKGCTIYGPSGNRTK